MGLGQKMNEEADTIADKLNIGLEIGNLGQEMGLCVSRVQVALTNYKP